MMRGTRFFNSQNQHMKRFINKYVMVSLLALFMLGACKKDFLSRSPSDARPDTEALSTESALENALNGAYAFMRSVGLYGRDIPVIGDLHADNTFIETQNSGRYLQWYDYSVASNDGNATGMWTNAYVTIQRVNRILEATVTGGRVDGIKAEARAIRALMYFNLVRTFAQPYSENPAGPGVPLILAYNPYFLPDSRNTIDQVYAQIISDLQAAFADAPDYSSSALLSKYAIEGLLAKVYLNKGDYANAKTAAADVIENGGFTLVAPTAFAGYWANPSSRTDGVETLFEIDADVVNNNNFDDLGRIYQFGYNDIYASRQLFNLYRAADVRTSVLEDATTKTGASAVRVFKFPNGGNDDRDNLKVLRLAEVYLIAAEAAARTSDEPGALDYLNDLMAAREPGFTYASAGAQLLTDIITERRKELAFEGDRLFDLNRLKMPIARIANTGSILAGPGNVNLNVPYPDNRRIAPIPQAELQANPGLADEQNPGY